MKAWGKVCKVGHKAARYVRDGARPSARRWVLTEVPSAVAGTAKGKPDRRGRKVRRGESWDLAKGCGSTCRDATGKSRAGV